MGNSKNFGGSSRKNASVSFRQIKVFDGVLKAIKNEYKSDVDDHQKGGLARELSIVEEGDGEHETTHLNLNNNNTLRIPDYEKDNQSVGSSTENINKYSRTNKSNESSRRPSFLLQEILQTRRPSAIMASLRRGSQSVLSSFRSKGDDPMDNIGANSPEAVEARRKNRRVADDALSSALSALYAKLIVIIGIALPVTEILTSRIPNAFYQGFYVYCYVVSIGFVVFVYVMQFRRKAVFTLIKNYHEKTSGVPLKKKNAHFGSFYLRAGAIAFGIGNMVYSGLELGQYFELQNVNDDENGCHNIFMLLTPLFRMCLTIAQMQFIFLNTTEMDHGYHKVISRFGLMHMVATNLTDWFSVLVQETKHEILHLAHAHADSHHENHNSHNSIDTNVVDILNSTVMPQLHNTTIAQNHHEMPAIVYAASQKYHECLRTNIMGSLVQNASPFLFPCTIEYSLICAVILFEMWKKVRSIPEINKTRRNSLKPGGHLSSAQQKSAYHFSIDCSKAHRGMFAGIVVIVMTIICLIMYFVLHQHKDYDNLAMKEVIVYEICLYTVCTVATITAFIRMRDLKFQQKGGGVHDHHASTVKLDCTLLVMAAVGVYVYGMFSIIGSVFAYQDETHNSEIRSVIAHAILSESLSLIEVSLQTLFILNACWRRCKGAQQIREKPGRQIVTFLLVANISMWFINTLIKGHASFRPSHLDFYGKWAWVIITHISMPLAIFYRFHSTICLFDIWKTAYKFKMDH